MTETDRLWRVYLDAEAEGVKETREQALERLLRDLETRSTSFRRDWAFDLARRIVDGREDLPVRFPLFRRILLPALVEGVTALRPGCARWLAGFPSLLIHCRDQADGLPEALRNPSALIDEALRVDPSDRLALEKWVHREADDLDYSLHELPTGVLYGSHGASAAECDQLLADLVRLRERARAAGLTGEYADLMAEGEIHYRAYADYLRAGSPGGSYERYFESRRPL